MSLFVTSGPTAEPISLAGAKLHTRIESSVTADDAEYDGLIAAVRQNVEDYTSRRIVQQTIEQRMDGFPGIEAPIRLLASPLLSVESISYVDMQGVTQTLASSKYRVDKYSDEPRITPVYGTTWPFTRYVTDAVTITYKVGYLTPVSVDASTDVLTATGHTFADGDSVRLFNTDDAPPAGLALKTNYYVINSTADTFQLSATAGGAAIDITDVGTGQTFVTQHQIQPLINGMYLLLAHLYENREASVIGKERSVVELPMGVDRLLMPYTVSRFT